MFRGFIQLKTKDRLLIKFVDGIKNTFDSVLEAQMDATFND